MSQSMNAAGPLHSRIENKPSKKKTLLSLAVVKVHLTESLERTESDIREICYQDKIFLHKEKPPPTSYSYMANQGYKICIIIDKICVCRGLNASGRNL